MQGKSEPSPLTRGTRIFGFQSCLNIRFIPAYAGNSPLRHFAIISPAVHPRLRGELFISPHTARHDAGSSPLTRGTRIEGEGFEVSFRFIPAYAGNSLRASSERSSFCGSSPLTRGTPYPRSFPIIAGRFIPAYAGNSGLRPAFLKSPTVHPRLRGELVYLNVMAGVPNGSSPLTRGTHDLSDAIAIFGRFIPAYAGNSSTVPRRTKQ